MLVSVLVTQNLFCPSYNHFFCFVLVSVLVSVLVTQNLFCPSGVRPVSVRWTGSGPEVNRKLPGSGPVCPSVRLSALSLPPYARDLQAQGACALRFFINQILQLREYGFFQTGNF